MHPDLHHWACLWKLYTKEKYAKHNTEKKNKKLTVTRPVQTTEKELVVKSVFATTYEKHKQVKENKSLNGRRLFCK